MRIIHTWCVFFLCLTVAQAESYRVFVGSYAKGDNAKGIHVLELNRKSGELKLISSETSGPNPSFLCLHPNGQVLYAVNEVGQYHGIQGGALSAFRIQSNGSLKLLKRHSTTVGAPCHLDVDPSGKMLGVANYSGGSVTAYQLKEDGDLGAFSTFVRHFGSSVHDRQKAPHAHSFDFSHDGRYAYVADLGIDRVVVYETNVARGELKAKPSLDLTLPPGSGPRHIAFSKHDEKLFVLNELSCVLSSFKANGNNGFEHVGDDSTLPENYEGRKSTAEVMVHPNNRFVYASDRGQDKIVCFKINADASLEKIQSIDIKGKTPRNFSITPDGHWLIAAGQNSNTLRVFKVNGDSGKLTPTKHEVTVPKPVCVVFQ